ncbi:MAG: hypothetical protein RIB53_03275 [Roseitalea porphyridii]|jgi:membrane associated rhomboid family serine protease|uniref:hypothetical protein n=1 Tax=Roseitalea porphyridii TaxID=1852022 RepID=UPI0032F036C1
MPALRRLGVIALGYLLASIAAGIAMSTTVWIIGPLTEPVPAGLAKAVVSGALIIAPFVALIALLPALVLVPLLERNRVRAAGIYVVLAVITGLGAIALIGPSTSATELVMGSAAGLAAGIVYWAVAGRRAGDRDMSRDREAGGGHS